MDPPRSSAHSHGRVSCTWRSGSCPLALGPSGPSSGSRRLPQFGDATGNRQEYVGSYRGEILPNILGAIAIMQGFVVFMLCPFEHKGPRDSFGAWKICSNLVPFSLSIEQRSVPRSTTRVQPVRRSRNPDKGLGKRRPRGCEAVTMTNLCLKKLMID